MTNRALGSGDETKLPLLAGFVPPDPSGTNKNGGAVFAGFLTIASLAARGVLAAARRLGVGGSESSPGRLTGRVPRPFRSRS